MEKIRGAGFILAPQFQLRPVFAVRALVATAQPACDKTSRSDKKRGGPWDAPPFHARRACLTLISTDLQLPLFGDSAEKITGDPEPLFKIKSRECNSLRLG